METYYICSTNDTFMRTSIKDIPIEILAAKYQELGNVWKVGEYFGFSGQAVYSALKEAGYIRPKNVFTEGDMQTLRENYKEYRKRGELQKLADLLGRTKQFICRKAKELGLTGDLEKYEFSEEKRKELSEQAKEKIRKYGHPRGARGLVHTEEAKQKMSEASKRYWEEHFDELHTQEMRKKRSDDTMRRNSSGDMGTQSRSLVKEVEVGGKTFVIKSSWEYDIALYLDYLKSESFITDWNYEPKRFVFEYNTLGVRSYKPDFCVTRGDRVYYLEVKGWPDKKYEIKRELMQKEHPDVKIIYIMKDEYEAIERKHAKDLPGWSSLRDEAGRKIVKKCSVDGCDCEVIAKGLCRHHYYLKYQKKNKDEQ